MWTEQSRFKESFLSRREHKNSTLRSYVILIVLDYKRARLNRREWVSNNSVNLVWSSVWTKQSWFKESFLRRREHDNSTSRSYVILIVLEYKRVRLRRRRWISKNSVSLVWSCVRTKQSRFKENLKRVSWGGENTTVLLQEGSLYWLYWTIKGQD